MALAKRIAVTLPAGPRIEDTIARVQWAEEHGIPDAWFSDSGAPDTLTQVAAIAHHHKKYSHWHGGYTCLYQVAIGSGGLSKCYWATAA